MQRTLQLVPEENLARIPRLYLDFDFKQSFVTAILNKSSCACSLYNMVLSMPSIVSNSIRYFAAGETVCKHHVHVVLFSAKQFASVSEGWNFQWKTLDFAQALGNPASMVLASRTHHKSYLESHLKTAENAPTLFTHSQLPKTADSGQLRLRVLAACLDAFDPEAVMPSCTTPDAVTFMTHTTSPCRRLL